MNSYLTAPALYHWYHYRNEPLQNELPIGGVCLGMVEPQYHNYVALDRNKKDEYGVPEIKVQFTYSQTDIGVIHQMLEGLVRAADAMGVSFFSRDGNPPDLFKLARTRRARNGNVSNGSRPRHICHEFFCSSTWGKRTLCGRQ